MEAESKPPTMEDELFMLGYRGKMSRWEASFEAILRRHGKHEAADAWCKGQARLKAMLAESKGPNRQQRRAAKGGG